MATQDNNYLNYVSMLSKMVHLQDLSQARRCESQAAEFLLHTFGVLTHHFVAPAYVLHTGVSRLGYQQRRRQSASTSG